MPRFFWILRTIFLFLLLPVAGCSTPQIVLHDTINPPIRLENAQKIGVLIWPLNSPENRLFKKTMIRNLESIGGIRAIPVDFPSGFSDNPVSLENLSHITQSNVLILLHILSHTIKDEAISSSGKCSSPSCNVLSVPMWIRHNRMKFHIAIVQVFPYRIFLDKTIETGNETRKVPLSLFNRHFEPQKILNLKLYGKISQHIAYLLYPVKITLKRPFYPFDRYSRRAFKSLQEQKRRLALFFLNSDYSLYLKKKKNPPYQLYFDLGVVYENLGFYSLSDFYYKKGLNIKNKRIFVRLEHQVRSLLVYFIGINFFEEGS
ncbi:MAG: hypothetical protein M1297_09430 [Nitrospirae bacterium]|nr:hypothetical protein [Nitrospirota bacterium]